MKACKDCRHATWVREREPFERDVVCAAVSLNEAKTCRWQRGPKGLCGIDGELFEPRLPWWQRFLSRFRGMA
jgi:hypothetical protein